MNSKERGKQIRQQILRDVFHHPSDLTKHISSIFSITPQAVYRHLSKLETEGWLSSSGKGKGKRYQLGERREHQQLFALADQLAEDVIWRAHFEFIFEGLPENVVHICHYGFTEIVNNAIDHSNGNHIFVSAKRDSERAAITVLDDGEGIFHKIAREHALSDERQALLELSKGKLTTDPANHTGEGIFFTSRSFDHFAIDSRGLRFSHKDDFQFDYLFESEFSITESAETLVYMSITRNSEKNLDEVFERFTGGPEEFHFNKTVVPVRLAQYGDEKLISRSQAKRLLLRIEKFENVIFDFKDVTTVGQAFADEIFRVYANKHPNMTLLPYNMQPRVEGMVNKAIKQRNDDNA